jgi:hypothetical protein
VARACLRIGAGIARYIYCAVARQNQGRFTILRNVQTASVTKGLRISINQTLKLPGRESDHPYPFKTEGKKEGRSLPLSAVMAPTMVTKCAVTFMFGLYR